MCIEDSSSESNHTQAIYSIKITVVDLGCPYRFSMNNVYHFSEFFCFIAVRSLKA